MKKLMIVAICTLCFLNTHAQLNMSANQDTLPVVYIGTSTGINNFNAVLGISANVRVYNKLFVRLGAGTGFWGTKYSVGIKYDKSYGSGWSYSVSYSHCEGAKNMDFKNADVDTGKITSSTQPIKKDVNLDYLPVNALNFSAAYNWKIFKKSFFFTEFGYSFGTPADAIKVNDGSVLDKNFRDALNLFHPGGLILSFGISIGL